MSDIKKQKKFIILILVIIFCPLVFSIGNLLFHKLSDSKNKLRLNFKTHYFFKDELLSVNKILKNRILGAHMISNRALDLSDGWCVLGDDFSDALSESKALKVFSKKELNDLKDIIKSRNNWLVDKGIKFYIAIAPNKLTVYDTLVPIAKKLRKTKLQQLDSLCTTLGVSFINLGEKFKQNDSVKLYHKTDTHWNATGSFLGYDTAMDFIKKDFPKSFFKDYKLEELKKSYHYAIGDLNLMLKKEDKENRLTLSVVDADSTTNITKKLIVPDGYKNNPESYEIRIANKEANLKFLAFRDSFFTYCVPFFKANFRESVFIWDSKFDKELISKENPDIVFFELVERDIDLLLKNK